jgi:hypothetical protein
MPRPVNIVDGKRRCPVCTLHKPLSEFNKLGGKRSHLYDSFCKLCRREYENTRRRGNDDHRQKENQRRHTDQHRAKNRAYLKEYYKRLTPEQRKQRQENSKKYANSDRARARRTINRRELRLAFIEHYGGKCQCCGETTIEFLTIEHVNGGGRQERKTMNSEHLMRKLRREGWPDDGKYSVLCFNCNAAIGIYGYCPHQQH